MANTLSKQQIIDLSLIYDIDIRENKLLSHRYEGNIPSYMSLKHKVIAMQTEAVDNNNLLLKIQLEAVQYVIEIQGNYLIELEDFET